MGSGSPLQKGWGRLLVASASAGVTGTISLLITSRGSAFRGCVPGSCLISARKASLRQRTLWSVFPMSAEDDSRLRIKARGRGSLQLDCYSKEHTVLHSSLGLDQINQVRLRLQGLCNRLLLALCKQEGGWVKLYNAHLS